MICDALHSGGPHGAALCGLCRVRRRSGHPSERKLFRTLSQSGDSAFFCSVAAWAHLGFQLSQHPIKRPFGARGSGPEACKKQHPEHVEDPK